MLVTLGMKPPRWLGHYPMSSQVCGETWEVCEGFDFASAREEIKVKGKIDLWGLFGEGKWLTG